MSTNDSIGRTASTQTKVRSAYKPKKNRSHNLCAFTFADGRQCRTPRCSGHLHFCYFHAQKEAESLAAQQVGQDISRFLPTKLLTACDLGAAMSRLFCAVAQGQIKPKVASTLAYLAQTMLQSIPIAKHEYINAFDTDIWRNAVRVSFRSEDTDDPEDSEDAPASAPKTSPQSAASASAPTAKPAASPAPQPSAQPAPSAHTPLPPTITEFFQQVMAGRNTSRSEIPTPSGSEIPTLLEPGRETGSSVSSLSSASSSSDSAPARTSSTQPAPSLPAPPPPSPGNSQPAPTSPAPQSTPPQPFQPTHNSQHNSLPTPAPPAPPPVPRGFGAPANWDVLIPPKPRRRFSRHWRLESPANHPSLPTLHYPLLTNHHPLF